MKKREKRLGQYEEKENSFKVNRDETKGCNHR